MDRKCASPVLWISLLYSFITAVHCDCGLPPDISYASLKQEFADKMTFAVKSTVKYDCRPGFIRAPGHKNYVTCQEDSEWSSSDEFCRLRSCGYPGDIENGYFDAEDFLFASKVEYHCNTGYYLVSKRTYRECKADGTWSNSVPECEAVICPPPASIPNGTYYPVKDEYQFADAVKYECNKPNMVMEYDSSVYCMDNGNWSDTEPQCIEVNCEPPHVPHSRKLLGFVGPYRLNSMVRFECNKGFTMEGSDTIICTRDSTWHPSKPQCKGFTCPEPSLLHGRVARGYKFDGYIARDSITLECDTNYKLKGANRVTCGSDFEWYPKLPTCERASFCPEPILVNGRIVHGKKTDGYYEYDSITLDCNSDYKLKGKKKLRCTINYQWNYDFPICELENGCSSPQIKNGRVTYKNDNSYDPEIDGHGFSSKDVIDITCNSGYIIQGKSRSTCVYQRTWKFFTYEYAWSPKLPTCQRQSYDSYWY